jgi:hypothetical protein
MLALRTFKGPQIGMAGTVCSVAGEVVVEFGDWANAAVAKTRPTAVLSENVSSF